MVMLIFAFKRSRNSHAAKTTVAPAATAAEHRPGHDETKCDLSEYIDFVALKRLIMV